MGLIATERMPVRAPIPWRAVAGVALLILALVAAALLAAGGGRPTPPPPFGVARNGAILVGNGDISVRALDGTTQLIIGGTTDDFAANYTRDGTRIVWLRRVAGTPGGADERLAFFIADPEGRSPHQVSDPLNAPNMWDISADSSVIVAQEGDPSAGQRLVTIDLVGTTGTRPLDVGDPTMTMSSPGFMGPDGAEIVFRGQKSTPSGVRAGVFAVHLDGSGIRELTKVDGLIDGAYQEPSVSPDGRWLTYTWWDPVTKLDAVHLVNLKTGAQRVLDQGTSRNQAFAGFSPDSRNLTFLVYDGSFDSVWLEPVEVPGPARQIGPERPVADGFLTARFSPDGRSIVVVDEGSHETRLVDVQAGGDGQTVDWTPADAGAWQRLAP